MYLPAVAVVLKIPLIFLSRYLAKIRGGWERGKKKGSEQKADPV